ncbi:MarR family transcriptional regulator [Streptomyces kaniharaensis]|uniref:MarR family transcriptional regulator n=1 Tax=Streptomyces kaniharaensis TaxID=212423 RepID=A0A6N7KYN1_9ACTN|nr:winged helix-turn-helix domain-containing protein [Streptomyces kaniharaensis]MQS16650.1 MarR family transcriptional regulator [Streptomyces kaniharaensis]
MPQRSRTNWTFLTSHARVLGTIARDPGIRLRDIAAQCDLTERAVRAIVADLETAGYLTHTRTGRRNRYEIVPDTRLRHPADGELSVAALLAFLTSPAVQTFRPPVGSVQE